MKEFARNPDNVAEVKKVAEELKRLGYDDEAKYILDIQINPERDVNNIDDFGRFKLGSYFDESSNPAEHIKKKQILANLQDNNPSYVVLSRSSFPGMLDKAVEQTDLATIKHPKIANATAKGYIGSGVKAVRNILDDEDRSYSEVGPYIENIKNDDLALRMWKAGFRPKNLTKRQVEYIDEEISR